MSDTTSVPSPTWTDTGFVPPTEAAILAGVQSDLQAAFGGNLNFTSDSTPQSQLAASMTAVIGDKNDQFVAMQNLVDPKYTSGRWQDAIARIYFLERPAGAATTILVSCSGQTGLPIPTGATLIDPSTQLIYSCVSGGTIPSGGSIDLTFANTELGPVALPSSVRIYQTIQGWDSVSIVSGVVGEDALSASAFEQLREDTVEGNSFGALGSIIGAVAQVPGVTDYNGYDNGTAAPVTVLGVTVPANSIYVCVVGGSTTAVGAAILSKKPPGCGMSGGTSVTVYDRNPLYPSPIPYTITFDVDTPLPIYVTVTLRSSSLVPSTALASVQAAIAAAFAGTDGLPRIRLGAQLFASRFYPGIAALGPWAQIISVQVGTTSPGAANDVTPNMNQLPTFVAGNVTLTLASS